MMIQTKEFASSYSFLTQKLFQVPEKVYTIPFDASIEAKHNDFDYQNKRD